MVENGIRGGISTIMKRYAKANNKYMNDFNPEKESTFIQYLDANNLYGWAMSEFLPVNEFRWMNARELQHWDELNEFEPQRWNKFKPIPDAYHDEFEIPDEFYDEFEIPDEFYDEGKKGCILEVDLEYPKKLHDAHNENPLAPEQLKVNKVDKLIPNLNDKKKYVVHHKTLRQYLDLGLKITKIHRGVKFNERPWLKDYIRLNTDLRTKGTTDFEDFFKIMNNSVFGKTMENIRNRVDVRLITKENELEKLAKKQTLIELISLRKI